MKPRQLSARKNLKKAIYIGGGMSTFTAAVGLGVSLPVYYSIQKELAKGVSNLIDLSSFMSQLTDKLGVPADSEFSSQLAGGYEIVYSNGETRIYKNTASGKSLILNMNSDGSIGSAAQLSGPAAQSMLGIIKNAQDTLSDDAGAMEDILGPFVDNAEDTSLSIESTVTGNSRDDLIGRNALAGVDLNDPVAVRKALEESAHHEAIKIINRQNPGISKEEMGKLVDTEKEKQQKALELAKNKAIELAKIQAEEAKMQQQLKDAQLKANSASDKTAALAVLKKLEVQQAKAWLKINAPNTSIVGLTDDEILKLKKTLLENNLKAVQTELDNARVEAEKRAAIALQLASAQIDSHQMDHLSGSEHSNVLIKIAKSIPASAKALMNAMFGYLKPGASTASKPNDHVKTMLEDEIVKQGMSRASLVQFESVLTSIHKAMGSDWASKVVDFSILANTYSYKESATSKLLVLSAKITKRDQSFKEIIYVARATDKSPRDFENARLKLVESNLNSSIKNMSTIISGDVIQELSNVAAKGIIDYLNGKISLKPTINQKQFDEVMKLAVSKRSLGDVHQEILQKLIADIGQRYLTKGDQIHLTSSKCLKMIDDIIKADKTTEGKFLTQTPPTKSPWDFAGELSHMVVDIISKNPSTNYDDFADGISQIINSIGYSGNIKNINELISLVDSSDPKAYLKDIKEFIVNPTGAKIINNPQEFKVMMDIIKNSKDPKTVLDNFNKMVSDKNAKFFMDTPDKIRTMSHYSDINKILSNFAKVDSSLGTNFIKNNSKWLVDNINNPNLLAMIADPNKMQFMNDERKRDIIIHSKNIKDTLDNLKTILDLFGNKFTNSDPHFTWFEKIINSGSFNEIMGLFISTSDPKQILADLDRIKEIIEVAQKAIHDDPSKTNVYAKILTHIIQVENIPNYESFYGKNEMILIETIVNGDTDITQAIKDFIRYINAAAKPGAPSIDLTDENIMKQIIAASAITANLEPQHLQPADQTKITDAITSIIASKLLTQDEFKVVAKYTETVFKVFSNKDDAVKQLIKVLDPKLIKSQISHIRTFNQWIDDIESKSPGTTITKSMIEKYVWTKDIEISKYAAPSDPKDKIIGWTSTGPAASTIVSAEYNAEDKRTYFVQHGGGDKRFVGTLTHKADGTTVVANYDSHFQDSSISNPGYISGQAIHDGKIYWVGLNNFGNAATDLWVYDIKTQTARKISVSHDGAAESKIPGEIRSLSWADGKLYGAISDTSVPAVIKEFLVIDPTTGKYSYLGKDKKIADITNHGDYGWTSGSFSVSGENYIVAPTLDGSKELVTVINVATGDADTIDITTALSGEITERTTAIVVGNYDAATHKQTLFYVNNGGQLVRIEVDVTGGKPAIDKTSVLSLIGKNAGTAPHPGTRGATFVNGAITLYASEEVVYISDQTTNLNEIFNFLLEHK